MKRYNDGDLRCGMGSRASDHDPTAARRCISKCLFARVNLSPSSRSNGHNIFETVHDGPFHLSSWGASAGLARLVPMNRCSPTVIIEEEFIGVVVILQLEIENLRNVVASDGLQGDSFL